MNNQEFSKKRGGSKASVSPQLLLEARPTGELEWHDQALAEAAREEQAEAQARMAAEAARGDAPNEAVHAQATPEDDQAPDEHKHKENSADAAPGAVGRNAAGADAEPMVAVVTEREVPVISVEEAERRERAAYLRGRNEAIRDSWMPRDAAPEPDEIPAGLFCGRRSVWEAFG